MGHKAMMVSLVILHLWGTILMGAVLLGRESMVIGNMFDSCLYAILANLLVLAGYRSVDKVLTNYGKGKKDDDTSSTSVPLVE